MKPRYCSIIFFTLGQYPFLLLTQAFPTFASEVRISSDNFDIPTSKQTGDVKSIVINQMDKEKVANLILRLANTHTTAQFQEYLQQLVKAEGLQNQAFSIKGGAAVVGDDYYILMGGEQNRLLDFKMNIEWIGKNKSEYEIIFYNRQRSSVVPKSIDEIENLWVFIYAQERVYFINIGLDSFGYYGRK